MGNGVKRGQVRGVGRRACDRSVSHSQHRRMRSRPPRSARWTDQGRPPRPRPSWPPRRQTAMSTRASKRQTQRINWTRKARAGGSAGKRWQRRACLSTSEARKSSLRGGQACIFCKRSHMTCDDARPCHRWSVAARSPCRPWPWELTHPAQHQARDRPPLYRRDRSDVQARARQRPAPAVVPQRTTDGRYTHERASAPGPEFVAAGRALCQPRHLYTFARLLSKVVSKLTTDQWR